MRIIDFFLRERNVLKTFLITVLLATGVGSAWGTDYANLQYNGENTIPSGYTLSSANPPKVETAATGLSVGGNYIDINNGGNSDFSDGSKLPTKRFMTFDVTEDCNISINFYSGSTGRILHIVDGDTKKSLASGKIDSKNVSYTLDCSVTGVTETKTIYLCGLSSSSLLITSISVTGACTSVTINGSTSVEAGSTISLTVSPTVAGTWSSGTTGVATVSGGVVTGVSAGTSTITFTPTDNTYCTVTKDITVTPKSCSDKTPTISGNASGCDNVTLTAGNYETGASLQWYKDGAVISGATSASYSVTESGAYSVVANKNCEKTSDSKTVTITKTPGTPTITQTDNTVTITADEGATIEYSLDGGTSWEVGNTFNITQNETVKARATNSCGTSGEATKVCTYSLLPTCGVIGSDAGTLDATTPYSFGDFRMYHGGNKDNKYAPSPSDLCNGAKNRYYMTSIIVELTNMAASQIKIIGNQKSAVTATTVEVADALDGTYAEISSGTITSSINGGCGEIVVPNINVNTGKFVKITFDGEVRVSGVCVTPKDCDRPDITGGVSTLFPCGTAEGMRKTTLSVSGSGASAGTWSSSNMGVATVSAGVVTAVAAGEAIISFTPTDETYCPATKVITVKDLAINGNTSVGKTQTITLTANKTGGTWSSGNTSVATVNASTGIVTGVAVGTAVITYTVNGCSVTHSVEVSSKICHYETRVTGTKDKAISGEWADGTAVYTRNLSTDGKLNNSTISFFAIELPTTKEVEGGDKIIVNMMKGDIGNTLTINYDWEGDGADHTPGTILGTVDVSGVSTSSAENVEFIIPSSIPVGHVRFSIERNGSIAQNHKIQSMTIQKEVCECDDATPVITASGPTTVDAGESVTLNATVNTSNLRWYKDGLFTGETSTSITVNQGGIYTVQADNTCKKVSAGVEVVIRLQELTKPTAPILSTPTSDGFKVVWEESADADVDGYLLHIYNSSTGAEVKTVTIIGSSTTVTYVTDLSDNTEYYAKLEVKGNGTTTKNSPLSNASDPITTSKIRIATSCIEEGFEDLTGTDNSNSCKTIEDGASTIIRLGTSSSARCDGTFLLALNGGNWEGHSIGGHNGSNVHSGGKGIYLRYGGYLTSPTAPMAMEYSVYVKMLSAISASDRQKDQRGLIIKVGDEIVKDEVYIDGELVEASVPSSTNAATFTTTGKIRLGDTNWHLVTVKLGTPANTAFTITNAGSSSAEDSYFDDVTIKCDPQQLTITPNLSGLDYVLDLGPSEEKELTLTGNDLPNETGTATLTGPSEFEVSLDGGVTWQNGSISFPYTNGFFVKTAKVRLPKDKTVGKYSESFTLSATGYSKPNPSVTVRGEVTLFPTVISCGQAVNVLKIVSPGLDTSNPSFMDLQAGENWTTSGTVGAGKNALGAYAFQFGNGSMISPEVNANDYDFLRLRMDVQPSSGSSENAFLVQVHGDNGYIYNNQFTLDQKQVYNLTIDLENEAATGTYNVIISSPRGRIFYVTNIVLEGTAKRKMSFNPGSISDFQSYPDCPSDVKELTIVGTCLDEGSSIDFKSLDGNDYFEFSADGATGWASTKSISYTGDFPIKGMKVYVRQKQGLPAGNKKDVILVRNGGKGSSYLTLGGQASEAGTWIPSDGATYNFSSFNGEAGILAIPFTGGPFCAAPTVTTSCSGVSVSNCYGGTYAASTSFDADLAEGTIYVKYTPGTPLVNCALAVTAAGETHTVKINWTTGANVATTGVMLSTASVDVDVLGAGKVEVKAKGTDMSKKVTITSTKFDVSMGNPLFGDFEAIEETTLGEMTGTLYVKAKSGVTVGETGTVTIATAGGTTVILNCTAK